jgi:hypothetical protein
LGVTQQCGATGSSARIYGQNQHLAILAQARAGTGGRRRLNGSDVGNL